MDLNKIYEAYENNEAAADEEYLNKGVRFTFQPEGIEKDSSGGYCAWSNIFGMRDPVKYGQHIKCHFRADQTVALAKFNPSGVSTNPGAKLEIRGICMGKTGMINTFYPPIFNDGTRGFYKASPAIAFKDCEVVEKSDKKP